MELLVLNEIIRFLTKIFDCLYLGLDVTNPEPLPNDHPLYSLPNCIITPHIGGDDEATREELKKIGLLNLINGLNGTPLVHQVPGQKIELLF